MLYTQQFLHLLLISRDDQAQLTVLTDTSQAISMGFPWDFMAMFRISWDLMESNWNKNPIWNRLE